MTQSITVADLFCGAGGTSTGVLQACREMGIRVDLTAVNHWDVAVATHTANHPQTRHLCASLDSLNPRDLYPHGGLDLLWASPECTHHSNARGGRPVSDQSRATAWCVTRWAEALRPGTIMIENVPEFRTWGPIGTNGKPLKSRRGEIFRAWVRSLEAIGYRVDHRILCSADYGDPTTRRRLFVQAVLGRRRIAWPEPTHAPAGEIDLLGTRQPWVPAREIIDWSVQGQSIFSRKRPLRPKTLARIEAGLRKFGLSPFVVAWDQQSGSGRWSQDEPLSTITTKARHGVVEPFLIALRGTSLSQIQRSARSIEEPAPTLTAGGGHLGVVAPYLVQVAHGGNPNGRTRSVDAPLPTVCGHRGDFAVCEPMLLPQQSGGAIRPVSCPVPTVATAGAIGLVEPFLVSYYGNGQPLPVDQPLDTVTTKQRFGLAQPEVWLDGRQYVLDIRFRMLQPHELAAANGFPTGYQFSGTKTEVVRQIGNAVTCNLAKALVRATLLANRQLGGNETKRKA